MFIPRAKGVFQTAWVVADLDASMRHWTDNVGVGPFFVMDRLQVANTRYRGEPTVIDFSVALAQAGDTQIELILQHDARPSVYRDAVPQGQTAFHHVGMWAKDFDAEVKTYVDQGFPIVFSGGGEGSMRFAYLDTRRTLGSMVEILEENAPVRERFQAIADAAVEWDGRDPVRRN